MEKVLVIATAAKEGGALSILKQFIESNIDELHYTILVDKSIVKDLPKKNNLEYLVFSKKNMLSRLVFDFVKINNIILSHKPKVCFNLQNVPVRTTKKQIVYMHQPIPFTDLKKLKVKFDSTIFFYKYLYFILIKLNNKFAYSYVVQTKWLKARLLDVLKRNNEDVVVFRPVVKMIQSDTLTSSKVKSISIDEGCFNFFYPASAIGYKNHDFLIDVFSRFDKQWLLKNNVKLYLTIKNEVLQKKINSIGLGDVVFLLGYLSRDEVSYLYKKSSSLIFPSLIETFGLPLIEAAYFKLPIVTVNLDYAREVLSGYKKVLFCDIDNVNEWAEAITHVVDSAFLNDDNGFCELNDEWESLHRYLLEEAKSS